VWLLAEGYSLCCGETDEKLVWTTLVLNRRRRVKSLTWPATEDSGHTQMRAFQPDVVTWSCYDGPHVQVRKVFRTWQRQGEVALWIPVGLGRISPRCFMEVFPRRRGLPGRVDSPKLHPTARHEQG